MTSPHIQRLPVRLSLLHKRCLYGVASVLFISGLGWLIAHYILKGSGNFGESNNASEPWWLRVHGAAAMGFLITLGSLLPGHIVRAWQLRKNHRSGLTMLGMFALLIVTGYGLYYVGDEQSRPWISAVHWTIGLGVSVCLPLHVFLGKRRPATSKAASPSSLITPLPNTTAFDGMQQQPALKQSV